jgi:hypothetical protein
MYTFYIVQKHKIAAVNNPDIAPRKVFANITAELGTIGGGVIPASQKSLASNIHHKRSSVGGLPKLPKVFLDILDTFPEHPKFNCRSSKQ